MNEHGKRTGIDKPQLKSTVIPVPLSGQRLALHRGPFKAEHDLMVWNDPRGLIRAALANMDGTRSIADIANSLVAEQFHVGPGEVRELVENLGRAGVVVDAAALSHASMTASAAARYSRNLNCWAALSSEGRPAADFQAQVGRAHVLILGVGGVGTSVALALAMAGCGHLTLVDFDLVELQNLNRQLLFTTDDVGKPKVRVAKTALERINPDVTISTIEARLETSEQVHQIIESTKPDFVAAAADRPTVAIDRWINNACFALRIPFSSNSVSGHTALFWTRIPGKTGCFNCDDLWVEQWKPDHYEVKRYREKHDLIAATSAFSFTAMTIGALTASEIIRSIVGWSVPSAGRTILVDFSTLNVTEYNRPPHPRCSMCRSQHSPLKNLRHATKRAVRSARHRGASQSS